VYKELKEAQYMKAFPPRSGTRQGREQVILSLFMDNIVLYMEKT
jgi:hypothetical protein